MKEFLQTKQSDLLEIINTLKGEFSSHDFIEIFSKRFEADYIDFLVKYKNSGEAFKIVHSQIGLYLSNNMSIFSIEKTHRKGSENVHGNVDNIQWWIKK